MKNYGEIEGLQKNISTETRAAYDRGYKRGYEDGYARCKAETAARDQKPDSVNVGDEIVIVRAGEYINAVVLDIDMDGDILWLLDENGCNCTYDPDDTVTKTGRHFDQIGELLKLLREDEI